MSDTDISPHQSWMAMAETALRGAEFDSLVRETEDGLVRGPLFTKTDLPDEITALPRANAPQLAGRAWHIMASVVGPDIAQANKQALEDLRGGASGLRLEAADLKLKSGSDVKRLFDQVHTDLIPITLAPSAHNAQMAELMLSDADLKTAYISLGLDVITDIDALPNIITHCPDNWRAVTINAAAVHDSGGSDVQELAIMAGRVAHAMKTLGPHTTHAHIHIEIATSQDGHMGIAKLRAARRIYERIAESFDINDPTAPLHAVTSRRMMQSVDPWTNMLRVASAAFGAICGGADYITTRAFTDAIGLPTRFGHRMARNVQIMLMEESHLGQVQDPAFGSYYHEAMTEKLARAAWAKFQEIEAGGGIETYLSGDYKSDLASTIAARTEREEPILGVTLHPAETNRKAKVRSS